MRFIVEPILAMFARQIIAKYKPVVIGITGSMGKTSTRAAVFAVVSQKYRAFTPPKNLNEAIGLPLGVIGLDSPGRSVVGWLTVCARAVSLLLVRQRYPEVLVLEYGVDRVGEMDALLAIVRPDIAILTSIGLSHYQFFQSAEAIEEEKGKLLAAVQQNENGTKAVIVNADNERALNQKHKAQVDTVLSYGRQGDVHLTAVEENLTDRPQSVLHITTPSRTFTASVAALGTTHVSSSLAGVAVAEVMGIETDLIEKGLAHYRPIPGRLNVFAGLRKSIVIDDTYNAAPDSMHEALQLFARFPANHKIAVVGDMLELGGLSDDAHVAVGKQLAALLPTHVVTVGPNGRIIAEAALAAGFPEERLLSFGRSEQAAGTVRELMREESVVLVKGSQGVRMEKIAKEIMAEPMRASELLCRQYGKWLQ